MPELKTNKMTIAGNTALALIPITPYTFNNEHLLYSVGRIILYGGLSALTFEKHRKVSYIFAGAAGLSLMSSLAGTLLYKQTPSIESQVAPAPTAMSGKAE